MMIHNPMTVAMGDTAEMQKAIEMLASVKDSIINAYEIKTGLSRAKLSHLMDAETWMDANKAVELGFADDVLARAEIPEDMEPMSWHGRRFRRTWSRLRCPCCIPKQLWSTPSWIRSQPSAGLTLRKLKIPNPRAAP